MKCNAARDARDMTKAAITGAMLFATLTLSACGGGDHQPFKAATRTVGSGSSSAGAIKWEGQSQSVKPVDGKLAVLWPSNVSADYGSLLGNFNESHVDAQALKEVAPGAYSVLADRATLLSGMITDLSGNGQYAIGRWTNGNLSAGQSYNANQGRAWAVGTPVRVDFQAGSELMCKHVASTRPVAVSGNTPPGKVVDASARIYVVGGNRIGYDLSLEYSIGSDSGQRMTASELTHGYQSNRKEQHTFQSRMFGQDPQKPYFTVAYTMEAPTTGTIHGLTVMACEMHAHSADTRPTEANSAASADGHQSDQGDSGTAAIDSPADAGADVIGNESRPGSSNVDTIAPQPDNLSVAANQPAAIVDTPPSLDTIRPHPENLSATVDRQAAITFESPSAVDSVSQVPEAVPSSAEAQAAAIARRNAEWEEIEERLPGAVLPKN